MRFPLRLLPAALLCALALSSRRSEACDYGALGTHTIDPAEQAVDATPPSAISSPSYTVRRGHAPESDGCRETWDSCADIGSISVHFEPPTDDRTATEELGYRVEVTSGRAPSDPTWPTAPVRASNGDTLFFHWADGERDDQETLDFTLTLRAVDRAGNEGPATEVRIRHGGSEEGCRVAGRGVDLSWWLIVAALGCVGLRARARRVSGG